MEKWRSLVRVWLKKWIFHLFLSWKIRTKQLSSFYYLLSVLHLFHFLNPLCPRHTMTALFFCRFEPNKYLNLRKRRLLMKKTGRNFPQSLILKKNDTPTMYFIWFLLLHILQDFFIVLEKGNFFLIRIYWPTTLRFCQFRTVS